MNNRQRVHAILNGQDYDRMPIVYFGFWRETLQAWAEQGHVDAARIPEWGDGSPFDQELAAELGFDLNWGTCFAPVHGLLPPFEERIIERLPDGSYKLLNRDGAVVMQRPGATSIPSEVDHLLKGRKEWEEHFLPRLQFSPERLTTRLDGIHFPFSANKTVTYPNVPTPSAHLHLDEGGLDYLRRGEWENPLGLYCGSLFGIIRNWLGLVNLAYLQVDDPALLNEIIDTVGELCYRNTAAILDLGAQFDFGHFWEDIAFRGGPLVNPRLLRDRVAPHYARITELLRAHGIDIVSLDCDGDMTKLVPVWLDAGINTMFPIEVGVWGGSILPWRERYGSRVRGVGGVDKKVLAEDRAAIDAEIERLRPLVDLGGWIPCLDHRIAPDAKWDNVKYYCERMRQTFG